MHIHYADNATFNYRNLFIKYCQYWIEWIEYFWIERIQGLYYEGNCKFCEVLKQWAPNTVIGDASASWLYHVITENLKPLLMYWNRPILELDILVYVDEMLSTS